MDMVGIGRLLKMLADRPNIREINCCGLCKHYQKQNGRTQVCNVNQDCPTAHEGELLLDWASRLAKWQGKNYTDYHNVCDLYEERGRPLENDI